MNAAPDTSLHKSGLIPVLCGGRGGLDTALLISSVSRISP